MPSHVALIHVSFAWPDGEPCLTDITATFSAGVTGVVGPNGSGKTTLLRLITGELTPATGRITRDGVIDQLPQHLTLRVGDTVADLLGIRAQLDALRAIEAGHADPRFFETIGDDWGIEARAREQLAAAGMPLALERRLDTLSGGEAMLVALIGLQVRRCDIAVLDEPTNNLDHAGRRRVYDLLARWRGLVMVASHDPELLRRADAIAEVRGGALHLTTGGWDLHQAVVMAEQEAAARDVRTAEQQLKHARRQRITALERAARQRQVNQKAQRRGVTKAERDFFANRAEGFSGRSRELADERVARAREALDRAESQLRDDEAIAIDLPQLTVPTARRLVEVTAVDPPLVLRGPERVAITGRNGAGKTRLLEELLIGGPAGSVRTRRAGYLPQRIDLLPDQQSVINAVAAAAPSASVSLLRARLARFGLRGGVVNRPVGTWVWSAPVPPISARC